MDPGSDAHRQQAFEQYVLPEVDVLYRVGLSITRNPADAEDLVQDTLLRAYRAIERFDGRHPRAWLLTILRNAQLNRVRRRRPELLADPDETMPRVADTSTDGGSAETPLIEQTFDTAVERAFADLGDRFRQVVEMVDLNGLSYQETADALDVPVGTVMSRLHRARRKMRKQLEAQGIDTPHYVPREAS
ncbi:MAG: RNA polymerase sigma factor [Acidimicrobiales bacterium]